MHLCLRGERACSYGSICPVRCSCSASVQLLLPTLKYRVDRTVDQCIMSSAMTFHRVIIMVSQHKCRRSICTKKLGIFRQKGGVLPSPKFPYWKKMAHQNCWEGGSQNFGVFSTKKKQSFMPPLGLTNCLTNL